MNATCPGIGFEGEQPGFKLCCEPPSIYTKAWPVVPSYLWSDVSDDLDKNDASWQWADNFGNNNHDITPDNLEDNPGANPYGFVMMNGPPGSIENAFADTFTVVEDTDQSVKVKPRSLLTTDSKVLARVWEPAEETIRVYCNYPADSPKCRRVFYKGAKDTIIRLPHHVGEGPWARIVSMEPEVNLDSRDLPAWAKRKRELTGTHQNGEFLFRGAYINTFV